MALKTFLVVIHVLSVALSVGGVLMLDVLLARTLTGRPVSGFAVAATRFISGYVKLGLIVVWASGLAIIASAPDGPASVLANPKLQAKIVVVLVLTLNALMVEGTALPNLERNVGRSIFAGMGLRKRFLLLSCGVVSTVSWLVPLVLGLAREWNGVVPADQILGWYLALLFGGGAAIQAAVTFLYKPSPAAPAVADDAISAEPTLPAEPVLVLAPTADLAKPAPADDPVPVVPEQPEPVALARAEQLDVEAPAAPATVAAPAPAAAAAALAAAPVVLRSEPDLPRRHHATLEVFGCSFVEYQQALGKLRDSLGRALPVAPARSPDADAREPDGAAVAA